MKKLLLLLMIIPMIGFGQRDTSDLDLCNRLTTYLEDYDEDWGEDGVSPVQLIDLLACAARHKNSDFLEVLDRYQYFGDDLEEKLKGGVYCEHLEEFSMLLSKGPTSNRDIKTLNRYISQWSNWTAYYVSPMIPFGGKEYIKVAIYDQTLENGLVELDGSPSEIGETGIAILFTNEYRGSNNWRIIMHPERLQKAIYKFFKKEKNWWFDDDSFMD